ncbi:hypothetical protein [Mesorhizobium sp. B1-1-5]|uniref:hypothetical protein n=1 Tax=Mesorhizobium sp. B1-1-5 TaxID=2589979 RepID=UPI001FEFD563|nr:hypothetical protein [Mesorhizobium sp. B1-1-5]
MPVCHQLRAAQGQRAAGAGEGGQRLVEAVEVQRAAIDLEGLRADDGLADPVRKGPLSTMVWPV